ncbi:hypothetical protein [Microvirga thermotolerans]|uniref:Uncharacterized protein n=1 Tax=Microvirga thermotolerans TaxID=2651334 RepID=A0A5P9JVT0_9HYPH|nr:hypothetical protein [Microvirga thermotolerans]QFU16922.1 hypothetical protein GDR74_12200 [Microvirga thermotolerans]
MPFDLNALLQGLQECYSQSGVLDFDHFLGQHLNASDWIIASDYNIGAPGAKHDVFAFACYPVEQGWSHLSALLSESFPADFKNVSKITREQRRFFDESHCFCFIFMVPRTRRILRSSAGHKADLAEARDVLKLSLRAAKEGGYHPDQVAHLQRFHNEAQKKNFSLDLFETILLLSGFHAFVSGKIALRTKVRQLGWFPDRDNMTTFCASAWSGLAFMMFETYWRNQIRRQVMPTVHIVDHQVKGLHGIYDPLIRVPDFFAAVFSRLDPEGSRLIRPDGARNKAIARYLHVLVNWLPRNRSLWLCRVHWTEAGVRAGRIVGFRTKRRLRTLDLT